MLSSSVFHSTRISLARSSATGSGSIMGGTAQVGGSASLAVVKSFDRGNFCNLCKEPFGQWNEHRGKRDHISLELFFNVIAEQARAWRAEQVLWDFQDRFDPSLRGQESYFGEGGDADNVEVGGNKNNNFVPNPRLVHLQNLQRKVGQINNSNSSQDESSNATSNENSALSETGAQRRAKKKLLSANNNFKKLPKKLQKFYQQQQQQNDSQQNHHQRQLFSKLNADQLAIRSIFNFSDREQIERRARTLSIVKYLQERGVLYLGPNQWKDSKLNKINMGHNGQLVLFWMQHPQIIQLFPRADAAQIASFSQVCYSMYSLETVFDFLGLGELVDVREVTNPSASAAAQQAKEFAQQTANIIKNDPNSAAAATLPSSAANCSVQNNTFSSSSNSSSAPESTIKQGLAQNTPLLSSLLTPEEIQDQGAGNIFTYELTWFDKSIILRNILGQVRWAMEGFGHQINHPIAQNCDPYIEVLCEELAHNIVTETLYCRTCEFVCRADKVWREMGCPTGNTSALTNHSTENSVVENNNNNTNNISLAELESFASSSLLPLPASPMSERGTARDVNKFGTLHRKPSINGRKSFNNSSTASASTTDFTSSSSSSMRELERKQRRDLSSFYSLPGVNTYQPLGATENAIQMINSCYHNAMNVLLGRDCGDANSRNGGEYHHDAVRYMRHPHDYRFEALEGLGKQQKYVQQQQKQAQIDAAKAKINNNIKKSGSTTTTSPMISMMSKKKAPLSETATRLMKESTNRQ